jgi:hypothetical protein
MISKRFLIIFCLLLADLGLAHDEGHGPKLTDSGKYGGLVAPIVDMKDIKKGAHADVIYKAELVLSSDGKVRLYLYDGSMKPLDLAKFAKVAKGVLETSSKGKHKTEEFPLIREGKAFVGQSPKPGSKPFNLDFHLKEGEKALLTAFDNLD